MGYGATAAVAVAMANDVVAAVGAIPAGSGGELPVSVALVSSTRSHAAPGINPLASARKTSKSPRWLPGRKLSAVPAMPKPPPGISIAWPPKSLAEIG